MIRVIGVDPDTDRHGVAVYDDGKLVSLLSLKRADLVSLAKEQECVISIENVIANNGVFISGNHKKSELVARYRTLGMLQRAMIELVDDLNGAGIPVITYAISSQWKTGEIQKKYFEQATGWTGRSNEDTRSAAYFGFLHVNELRRIKPNN
jgi:hypothetical protein